MDNKGPNLFIKNPDVWVKAVIATSGTGNDALQQPASGLCVNDNIDGVILRLRSAIRDKSIKFRKYIECNIVQPGQATVIAISGLAFPHAHKFSGRFPAEIVRAVYPVNNPSINVNARTRAASDPHLQYGNQIDKLCGSPVLTDVFLDPNFAFISAVLYSEADWGNPSEQAGVDFVLVHNSNATTRLPDSWMTIGNEYWWRDGQLHWQNHSA